MSLSTNPNNDIRNYLRMGLLGLPYDSRQGERGSLKPHEIEGSYFMFS